MFKGKTIVVSGGDRGIGRAIVTEFSRQRANVVFTYNARADSAQELVDALTAAHPGQITQARQCDMRDEHGASDLIEETVAQLGGIDVLVNNAGITRDGLIATMPPQDWHDVIDVNLTGVFNLTRGAVFQMMKQRKGSIVNITSVAGLHGNIGQVNYSSAKAGLVGFTRSLSKEVIRMGIRVNAVAPGFIDTDMTSRLSAEQKKQLEADIGMRRMGQADEVAKAVGFLASDAASYITGQVLAVDGGLVL